MCIQYNLLGIIGSFATTEYAHYMWHFAKITTTEYGLLIAHYYILVFWSNFFFSEIMYADFKFSF